MDAIDEQTVHVFIVLFAMMVFFFSGTYLLAQDAQKPYSTDVVSVGEPEFNATTHQPNRTDIINVTWETKTLGFNFTVPAGQWTVKGWLADSGWFSNAPDDYTFTIWESFTVSNERELEFPDVSVHGRVFGDHLLPRLGLDFAEMQDMFGTAPRIVRWSLIAIPMAFVLMLIKIGIAVAEAMY